MLPSEGLLDTRRQGSLSRPVGYQFDRWVLWSRQRSSKPGRPGDDVSELESTEYLFLFHGLSLDTLGKK
jgi:hypothetical protein